jgi:hypothetical protein
MLIVIGVLVLVVVVFIIQSKNNPNSGSSNSSNSTACQVRVTADVLHVRTSPDPNASIVKSLSNGVVVPAEKTVQNGFRQLGDNQWVSSQFVTPVSGSC